MNNTRSSWQLLVAASWAVLQKDLRSELRTRYAINALVMFALATVLMVSMYLGTQLRPSEPIAPAVYAVLLWIAIFFAALTGLARTFVQEEATQTAALLRLHAPPLAILIGKWLFNVLLLVSLTALTTALFGTLVSLQVAQLGVLLATLLLGSIGLATATTITAAIIAQANVQSALFAPLAFPILLPLLLVAIRTTDAAIAGTTWAAVSSNLQAMLAYIVVTATSALLLFPMVWEA